MASTATRLITLIMLLQRQPNQSAANLARELGVSVRTLQRYIEKLGEMGIPVYATRGPYGGYSLVRGYKMPPLVFTPAEAVALYLGASLLEMVWGPLYGENARGALAKLDNVLPEEQRTEVAWAQRRLRAVGISQVDPERIGLLLNALWEAIHQRRVVSMVYRGRQQAEPLSRDVEPYLLVHSWGQQYCIGYCRLRQDVRTFRLDRILELRLLEVQFEQAYDFDLEAYVASQPFFRQRIEVQLRFAPEAVGQALDHQTVWDSLEEHADGSLLASFEIAGLETAANVVLSYGHQAEIVAPEALRDVVRERALAVAARHE